MIRQALETSEDIQLLDKIEQACFPAPHSSWTPEAIKASIMRTDSICLLNFEKDKATGYALATCVIGQAELLKIAVLPDHRRNGVGIKLLKTLETQLQKLGNIELFLECRESNLAALKLYKKTGFIVTGHRKKYYRDTQEDAVIMKKTL